MADVLRAIIAVALPAEVALLLFILTGGTRSFPYLLVAVLLLLLRGRREEEPRFPGALSGGGGPSSASPATR